MLCIVMLYDERHLHKSHFSLFSFLMSIREECLYFQLPGTTAGRITSAGLPLPAENTMAMPLLL